MDPIKAARCVAQTPLQCSATQLIYESEISNNLSDLLQMNHWDITEPF